MVPCVKEARDWIPTSLFGTHVMCESKIYTLILNSLVHMMMPCVEEAHDWSRTSLFGTHVICESKIYTLLIEGVSFEPFKNDP